MGFDRWIVNPALAHRGGLFLAAAVAAS